MAPPNLKIKKACEAMKLLDIPETRVKLVLKKLLKTYENNWELIEDDGNYTALAEALLDEDTEANENEKKKKKEVKKESNSRGKRKATEKQTQALVIYKEDDELEEEDEVPLKKRVRRNSNSLGSSMSKKEKEEDPKPEEEEDDKDSMPELPSLKLYSRRNVEKNSAITLYNNTSSSLKSPMSMEPEMKSNAGALAILNDDPVTDHKPMTPENSPALILGIEKPNASSVVEECNAHKASSSSGEAKISLSFTPANGEDTTNLCLPSMEDFLRAMEEKCLKTYKITHPGFSVLGFTKDMCSCYIDLVKNPTKHSLETKTVSNTSKAWCEISADGWRAISNIQDITFGEENVMIPWKNDINEEIPSAFRYISQCVVFQEAALKFFSLSSFSDEQCCFSSCIGDCLVASSPCKCTTAYTVDSLVKDDFLEERISEALDERKQELMFCKECPMEKAKKEEFLEPCKGHIKRKAVKECWIKCGCTNRCGNKTVQRGIHNKLEVFYTPNGKGWGLRTLEKLRKGAFVCEYIGEILTVSELY